MPGFVVDTESLIDVANSLTTLRHVLNAISNDDLAHPAADIGGQAIGQQLTTFNNSWMDGVTAISGQVQTMTLALLQAAAHYDHTEHQVADQSHHTPAGSGPVVAGRHTRAPTPPAHHQAHTPRHEHPRPAHHHDARHEQGSGTGTTTIGGPRMPITATGSGTGTTTIGGRREGRHDHRRQGSGTATITIGGSGAVTVQTGHGTGHGTTEIGGAVDGDVDGGATAARTPARP